MKRIPPAFLATILLWGCATNPFAESYHDLLAGVDLAESRSRMLPYSGTTKVLALADLGPDGMTLTRRGYIMIGEVTYEGRDLVSEVQIGAQGRKVGADLVLYRNYLGISRNAVPIADYPDLPSTPHWLGPANAGSVGSGSAIRTVTYERNPAPNTPGTISTSMVPTVRLPAHEATFWRKRMSFPE